MNRTALETYGGTLIKRGYNIVPIAAGTKYPKDVENWQSIHAKRGDVAKWSRLGFEGVGVLSRHTPAIDVDVYDENMVRDLVNFCAFELGEGVVRVGRPPKTLLVYRTDTPFTKMRSTRYRDSDGRVHHIEVLGDGQQFVAYGEHPDIRKPYTYEGAALGDTSHADLPLLCPEDVTPLFDYFDVLAKAAGWQKAPGGNRTEGGAASGALSPLEKYVPPLDITDAGIDRALAACTSECDDYATWVRVGMALYHQFDGSDEGLEKWDSWSSGSVKYVDGTCGRKWRTFKDETYSGKPVTFASVLALAKERRPNKVSGAKSPVGKFIERYVFIEEGNLVADLKKPPFCAVTKLEEFRNATANVRHEVPAPTQADPGRMKFAPVHQAWMVHEDRKSAQGARYEPAAPVFYEDPQHKGIQWVNKFYLPEFTEDIADPEGARAVFAEHMEYLFPYTEERERFLDWMAFTLQYPEKRCKWTPLHVSAPHGTGRGWVVELLGTLLGHHNCSKTKMKVLAGEGSAGQFQDYLNETLVCAIEEVRERGGKRYTIGDEIRDLLTENYLELNLKYGGKRTQRVFTNFFFMSNHSDALVLTPEDRRINVFRGPEKPKGLAYYSRLYKWLETGDGVAAVHNWLKARDLSDFNWQRSTVNAAREEMIDGTMTETETVFRALLNAPPKTVMTFQEVKDALTELEGGDAFDTQIDDGQVLPLLKQHCIRGKAVKVQGRTVRPWIMSKNRDIGDDEIKKVLTS